MENFIYRNNARKRSTTVILALIVTGIFIAWALLDAHIIVVASLIACVTLAIVDWIKNPKYVAEISANNISWTIGDDFTAVPIAQIDHVVLSTRLDFSVRVTFHMTDGAKIRMHPACTPPPQVFKAQLQLRDIKLDQKHFTFVS